MCIVFVKDEMHTQLRVVVVVEHDEGGFAHRVHAQAEVWVRSFCIGVMGEEIVDEPIHEFAFLAHHPVAEPRKTLLKQGVELGLKRFR